MKRKNLAVFIGALLLGLAALVSASVLEAAVFPEGTITGTRRRASALMAGQVLLVVTGLFLLVRRPRVTSVHLTAFALMSGICALLGAGLLQAFYVPPALLSGWKTRFPASEQNQLGFRGRPISYSPEDRVVLLLGDSQVEAAALPFDGMPEQLLERRLGGRTKVFGVGTGGYGQDQELLALEQYYERYRADVVALWETPLNDVWNNVFNTNMASRNPKPTFWLDNKGGLQGPTERFLEPLGDSKVVVAAIMERAFGVPWRDKNWERSLPEPYAPLSHYDGPVQNEWQERWNTNLGRMRDENLETEKTGMAMMFEPRSRRMQYGVDLTHALLGRIQQLVETHGGKLILFYAEPRGLVVEKDEVYVLNGRYYRVSKRQYEANLRDMNRGFTIEAIPVTIPDWRVSVEDGHLNAKATNLVISALAERLRADEGLDRSRTGD